MRYYKIVITDEGGNVKKTWSSIDPATGSVIMGALNVELDIPMAPLGVPAGDAYVRIWGIGLQDIGQSGDLNNLYLAIYGGMSKGLPLANPEQSGLLVKGQIFQAFGNWQDTTQTLDFVLKPNFGTLAAPANVVPFWKKGQTMASFISATLQAAFPKYSPIFRTTKVLIAPEDMPGYYNSIDEFAAWLRSMTSTMTSGVYTGVYITVKDSNFIVYDSSSTENPIAIKFTDLIGQPTWIGPQTVQLRAIMRADLWVGDYITLPAGQQSTTAQSLSQYRNSLVFTGKYQIVQMRHVGNFRQPDANSWVSIIDAVLVGQ